MFQMLKLLWDQSPADKDVFVAFDGNDSLHTFLVNPDDNEGITCTRLGQTKVGAGQVPALMLSGEVSLQTSGGKLVKMTLSTHEISPNISGTFPRSTFSGRGSSHPSRKPVPADYTDAELRAVLDKNIRLGRFRNAWAICQVLDDDKTWRRLGEEALAKHDLDTASRVYRHVGDIGMVWTLDEFRSIEDKKLIGGHVFMMMGDYDSAQNMYLQSGTPVEALHMRRDLLHWDQVRMQQIWQK